MKAWLWIALIGCDGGSEDTVDSALADSGSEDSGDSGSSDTDTSDTDTSDTDTSDTDDTDDTQVTGDATVRFVHGSTDLGTVSVVVDGVEVVSALDFGETAEVTLSVASSTFQVVADGLALASTTPSLLVGQSYAAPIGGSLEALADSVASNDDRALSIGIVELDGSGLLVGDLALAGESYTARVDGLTGAVPFAGAVDLDADGAITLEFLLNASGSATRRYSLSTDATGSWQAYLVGSPADGVEVLLVDPAGTSSLLGGDSRVRFLSLVPMQNGETFDVSLAGQSGTLLTGVTYFQPSPWLFMPSGVHTLEVRYSGTQPVVATIPVVVPESGAAVVVADVTVSGVRSFSAVTEGEVGNEIQVMAYGGNGNVTRLMVTDAEGQFKAVPGNTNGGPTPVGALPPWGGPIGLVTGSSVRPMMIDVSADYLGQRLLAVPEPFSGEVMLLGSDKAERFPVLADEAELWFVNVADIHLANQAHNGYDVEVMGHGSTAPQGGSQVHTNLMSQQVSGPHTVQSGYTWYRVKDTANGQIYQQDALALFRSFSAAVIQTGDSGYADYTVSLPHSSVPIPPDEVKITFAGAQYPLAQVGLGGKCGGLTGLTTNSHSHTFPGTVDPATVDLVFYNQSEMMRWDVTDLTPGKSWALVQTHATGELVAFAEGETTRVYAAGPVSSTPCP